MKHENADREQLSQCANLRYAKVLLVKLNARSSIDCLGTIKLAKQIFSSHMLCCIL